MPLPPDLKGHWKGYTPVRDIATGPSEHAVQVDRSATAYDGSTGVKIHESVIVGGGGNQPGGVVLDDLRSEVPGDLPVVFAARALSGSGTLTLTGNVIEEW